MRIWAPVISVFKPVDSDNHFSYQGIIVDSTIPGDSDADGCPHQCVFFWLGDAQLEPTAFFNTAERQPRLLSGSKRCERLHSDRYSSSNAARPNRQFLG
jgi:hypothetical protein